MAIPQETAAVRPAAVPPHVVVLSLALLLGLQPVVTDLYLPALPQLAQDLHAPMTAAQLTMSALILAFGAAQLVWGPVADRWGRRPVLLASLALFVLASIGAALAPTIGVLIGWRAAQGAAVAAAVVCARAMVRDLYEPHQGAQVMSKGLSGLGLIALASPAVGGLLAAWGGWRAALAAVVVAGALALIYVWRALPETNTRRNPQATRIGPLAATAGGVLRHPTFVAWAALTACTYGGLFTILAASSFAYIDVLGLSPQAYGVALGAGSLAYLAGTFACRRLLPRHGLTGTVAIGGVLSLAGGAGLSAVAWFDLGSAWALLLPHCVYLFAHGIHQPCGQTGAVGPFPHAAGVASALAGFALAAVAFGVGLWLGVAIDDSVGPMAYTVGFWSLATALVAWTLVRRHGVVPLAAPAA
jgi:DHA1 family bicyclomycin/chloramphenicol resistance-like MFS transporter